MACATVPYGIFRGCTKDQLVAREGVVRAAILARAPGMGQISAGSQNGKSFQFVPEGGMTLEQEMAEIQDALSTVDDTVPPLPDRAVFAVRPSPHC